MPRPIGPGAGTANRKPSTFWALPISAHSGGGVAFCCPVIRGVIGNRRSFWKLARTSGADGTRTLLNRDNGWAAWCEGSSPTTPCRPTIVPCRHSTTMSSTSGGAPCAGAARRTGRSGQPWNGWRSAGCPNPGYPIPGRLSAFASNTQGGSRMREFRPYGSVRGALSNGRPYRDSGRGKERREGGGRQGAGHDGEIAVRERLRGAVERGHRDPVERAAEADAARAGGGE